MNDTEKMWKGTSTAYQATTKRPPTEREVSKMVEAMRLFEDSTVDEMAHVVSGLILLLGDRIARQMEG